jgi:hypothetical protein
MLHKTLYTRLQDCTTLLLFRTLSLKGCVRHLFEQLRKRGSKCYLKRPWIDIISPKFNILLLSIICLLTYRPNLFMYAWQSGGVSWEVPTGRRDGRVSHASDARDLPRPIDSVDVQKHKFAVKGLKSLILSP